MKVLNFGSLNIDMVYAVDHFVRAGETLSSDRLVRFCGGKGLNQSVALARAGATVLHAGCIGRDGGMLLDLLAASGADTRFVRQLDEASGHAIIQVDKKGQNCILLYGGANLQITEAFADPQVLAACDRGDVLLLQNEINLLPYIVEKAYGRGMEIALNPSPINDQLGKLPLEKIRYFILNEIEGRELTGEEARRISCGNSAAAIPRPWWCLRWERAARCTTMDTPAAGRAFIKCRSWIPRLRATPLPDFS